MGEIFQFIVKSRNPNLIPIKIAVTRDGKSFMQTFWVLPEVVQAIKDGKIKTPGEYDDYIKQQQKANSENNSQNRSIEDILNFLDSKDATKQIEKLNDKDRETLFKYIQEQLPNLQIATDNKDLLNQRLAKCVNKLKATEKEETPKEDYEYYNDPWKAKEDLMKSMSEGARKKFVAINNICMLNNLQSIIYEDKTKWGEIRGNLIPNLIKGIKKGLKDTKLKDIQITNEGEIKSLNSNGLSDRSQNIEDCINNFNANLSEMKSLLNDEKTPKWKLTILYEKLLLGRPNFRENIKESFEWLNANFDSLNATNSLDKLTHPINIIDWWAYSKAKGIEKNSIEDIRKEIQNFINKEKPYLQRYEKMSKILEEAKNISFTNTAETEMKRSFKILKGRKLHPLTEAYYYYFDKTVFDRIQKEATNANLGRVINTKNLSYMLDNGLLNQFETGTSAGEEGEKALKRRIAMERQCYGKLDDLRENDREKYGALLPKQYNDDKADESWAIGKCHQTNLSHYGDAILIFKPSVKDRTTYILGDSLDCNARAFCNLQDEFIPTTDLQDSYSLLSRLAFFSQADEDGYLFDEPIGYFETQYHGELTMDDVAEIFIPYDDFNGISEEAINNIKEILPLIKEKNINVKVQSSIGFSDYINEDDEDYSYGVDEEDDEDYRGGYDDE